MRGLVFVCLTAAAVLLVAGCTGKPTPRQSPAPAEKEEEPIQTPPPDDENQGLDKGSLIVSWGDGTYHAELCLDREKQEATVYVHGGELKVLAPIKAKQVLLKIDAPAFEVVLTPSPQQGDPEGTASRFVGRHGKLAEKGPFSGTVSARIDGVDYAGTF